MAVVPVLLAPLGCRVPHLLKRGRGCGFPGLLGRLCEAWKGKRFVIARRFDRSNTMLLVLVYSEAENKIPEEEQTTQHQYEAK